MKRLLEIVLGLILAGIGFYNIPPESIVGGILAFLLIPIGLALIFGKVISGRGKKRIIESRDKEDTLS